MGLIEAALLRGCHDLGAGRSDQSVRVPTLLAHLEEVENIGRRYSWEVVCDITNRDELHLPLLFARDVLNGGLDEANFEEVALTPIARLIVESQSQELSAIVSLINGNLYSGGKRPPFSPIRTLEVLRELEIAPDISEDVIIRLMGSVEFPRPCEVSGDMRSLMRGESTILTVRARINVTRQDDRVILLVDQFPPGLSAHTVARGLSYYLPAEWSRRRYQYDANRVPIDGLVDLSGGIERIYDLQKVRITLDPGADPEPVIERLRGADGVDLAKTWPVLGFNGVKRVVEAVLPLGVPRLLTGIRERLRPAGVDNSLDALEKGIRETARLSESGR